jgi:hypothetical protein
VSCSFTQPSIVLHVTPCPSSCEVVLNRIAHPLACRYLCKLVALDDPTRWYSFLIYAMHLRKCEILWLVRNPTAPRGAGEALTP